MALAHESHHLVLDRHVPNDGRTLYFTDHFLEEVTQVVLLLLAGLTLVQLFVE